MLLHNIFVLCGLKPTSKIIQIVLKRDLENTWNKKGKRKFFLFLSFGPFGLASPAGPVPLPLPLSASARSNSRPSSSHSAQPKQQAHARLSLLSLTRWPRDPAPFCDWPVGPTCWCRLPRVVFKPNSIPLRTPSSAQFPWSLAWPARRGSHK